MKDMTELPIICSLQTNERQTRRQGLLAELGRRMRGREELGDGIRLEFTPDGDVLALIASVVEAERRCCRFLHFAIHVEPGDGPIYLDLTGPPGTREFLGGIFDERDGATR